MINWKIIRNGPFHNGSSKAKNQLGAIGHLGHHALNHVARECEPDFEGVLAKSVLVKIMMRNLVTTVFVKGYEFMF